LAAVVDPAEKRQLFERLPSVFLAIAMSSAGYLIGLAFSPLGATAG
jgi:hypothetical protein